MPKAFIYCHHVFSGASLIFSCCLILHLSSYFVFASSNEYCETKGMHMLVKAIAAHLLNIYRKSNALTQIVFVKVCTLNRMKILLSYFISSIE